MAINNINTKPKCLVDDCPATSAKRGYCDKHYRRIQRRGTLELVRQPPGNLMKTSGGYLALRINGITKLQHIWIAEKALGKVLPNGAIVHHINEIKNDNRNENLAIFPNKGYHNLIHARMKAFDACGNANYMKCCICKKYDDIANGTITNPRGNRSVFYHRKCAADRMRNKNADK